jgi:hypothetical protein
VAAETLTLEPAVARHTFVDGDVTRYPESHFLDFVIDGLSLKAGLEGAGNLVTALNRAWLPDVRSAVGELLGRRASSDLARGRAALLVCAVCGDLGCGAVTARLQLEPDLVIWNEFAWENGDEEPAPVVNAPDRLAFERSSDRATRSN